MRTGLDRCRLREGELVAESMLELSVPDGDSCPVITLSGQGGTHDGQDRRAGQASREVMAAHGTDTGLRRSGQPLSRAGPERQQRGGRGSGGVAWPASSLRSPP